MPKKGKRVAGSKKIVEPKTITQSSRKRLFKKDWQVVDSDLIEAAMVWVGYRYPKGELKNRIREWVAEQYPNRDKPLGTTTMEAVITYCREKVQARFEMNRAVDEIYRGNYEVLVAIRDDPDADEKTKVMAANLLAEQFGAHAKYKTTSGPGNLSPEDYAAQVHKAMDVEDELVVDEELD